MLLRIKWINYWWFYKGINEITIIVRRIVKRLKVTAQWTKNLETALDCLYPIWLMLYLFYLSYLFEILRCPFSQWSFSTHAIYRSIQCYVSLSVDPLLSVSLSPFSVYKYFDDCHMMLTEWSWCITDGLNTILFTV